MRVGSGEPLSGLAGRDCRGPSGVFRHGSAPPVTGLPSPQPRPDIPGMWMPGAGRTDWPRGRIHDGTLGSMSACHRRSPSQSLAGASAPCGMVGHMPGRLALGVFFLAPCTFSAQPSPKADIRRNEGLPCARFPMVTKDTLE